MPLHHVLVRAYLDLKVGVEDGTKSLRSWSHFV